MILPRAIRRAGWPRPISTRRRLRHTRCREVRRFLGLSVRRPATCPHGFEPDYEI